MSAAALLPTRRDEAFRYADLAALAPLWPVAPQRVHVAAGESGALAIVLDGTAAAARDLVIVLEDGAAFDLRLLNAGAAYGRIAVEVTLGQGARFHLGAAQVAGGDQTVEIVTEVTHAKGDAVSSQVVRSVLGGHATGTYLGRVAVARGANGTDGEQSIRAMLLDRTATANARPELEIYADDVKCAHGATVAEIDDTALYYLLTRGITRSQALIMLNFGFIQELINQIPNEDIAGWLLAQLHDRFVGMEVK